MRQASRVKQALEREIVTGKIPQGTHLEEEEIASQFGLSRTPVREALMMLEAIDLVERRPRQGAVVCGMSLKKLVQMLEYFSGIESFAAHLASQRIRAPEATLLKAAQEGCRKALAINDPDEYFNQNIKFHQAIYAASYNKVLIEQAEFFGQRLAPFLRTQHHQGGWMEKSILEHEEIMAAILQGKAQEAYLLLQGHVNFDSHLFARFASHME
jgi:DNA-binding GntR family transcriptional regulator